MKKFTTITIIVLISYLLISCKRENYLTIHKDFTQEYSINTNQVKAIAEHFSFSTSGKNKTATVKRIKELKPILTTKGDTALFIVNYEGAGFLLVSGDKRLKPILAYSAIGSFPIDLTICPPAALGWIMFKKEQIEKIKANKKETDIVTEASWNNLISTQVIDPIDPPPTCTDEEVIYGPLLQSFWGQGLFYNEYTPPGATCTHAMVGCTAVAMAQIMKYYNFPNDVGHHFYWSVMPLSTVVFSNGINEVARLMQCINDSLNSTYGCDYTTADKSKVVPSLINDFYFSSASLDSFDFSTIKNEIIANKPVLLIGGTVPTKHIWVCDGYQYLKYCVFYNGNWVGINEFHYLHMNWGWSGVGNGYFSPDNLNPSDGTQTYNLNYEKEMIHNIVPDN